MKTTSSRALLCTTAILALTLALTACKKDRAVDTQKPTIRLIAPKSGERVRIGNDHGMHLELVLTDNQALKSYKIDIHNNFTPHTHSQTRGDAQTEPFTFTKSWPLHGKRNATIHHHEVKIPANATPGSYHLLVFCTDQAGNESHQAVEIKLDPTHDDHHEEHHK